MRDTGLAATAAAAAADVEAEAEAEAADVEAEAEAEAKAAEQAGEAEAPSTALRKLRARSSMVCRWRRLPADSRVRKRSRYAASAVAAAPSCARVSE